MHEALKVYLKGSFVGWLSHETKGDVFSFRYDADYLAAPVEGALSFALPLGTSEFDSERTYAFFSVVFNFLIGNADAHAKNHSVVYHGSAAMFAPLYDLVSTAVYPELSREMAMYIGGDSAFESISRESFSRMAEECRVSPQLILSRLDILAEKMPTVLQRLVEDFRERWPSDIYGAIEEVVLSHISRIKE